MYFNNAKTIRYGDTQVREVWLNGTMVWPSGIIWTGLGSDNNWSTSSNWNIRVPQPYDVLQFAGTTRTTPNNNLTIDTPYNGIAFNSGAGAFTIGGNRFTLNSGSITNNSSNTQRINTDIVLGSNVGTVNCSTAIIDLIGNISGSGSLTKIGTSTLLLSGINSYTGNTFISAGFIEVRNNNALGTGDVNLADNNGGIRIGASSAPATTILNNRFFLKGQGPSNANNIQASKNTILNGLIVVDRGTTSPTNRLNTVTGATLTINGGVSGLPTMNSILTMNGFGTFILSSVPIIMDNNGANGIYSDTGSETVIIAVSGNRFQSIATGGNIRTDVPFAINNDNTVLGFTNGFGRINLNGNDQVLRTIQHRSTLTFNQVSGNNIFNNSSTFANLTANNTGGTTYVGSISGNINLIKTGTSTLTLSGDTALGVGPRYTGFTAISAGTLTTYALSSNPSNKVNFAQFTNTALTVNFTTSPIVGDSFILLPGRTVNSYPSVTLVNAAGRTASYNSTTSTLSVIT